MDGTLVVKEHLKDTLSISLPINYSFLKLICLLSMLCKFILQFYCLQYSFLVNYFNTDSKHCCGKALSEITYLLYISKKRRPSCT